MFVRSKQAQSSNASSLHDSTKTLMATVRKENTVRHVHEQNVYGHNFRWGPKS